MTNLLPALTLGAISGMRSMMALAFVSDRAEDEKDHDPNPNPALTFLTEPRTVALLKIAAMGELLVDKLPFAPARTDVAPLLGRMVMGGLVGAAISKDKWLQGGAVGAVGALVTAYTAYHIRKSLHDQQHIPDVILGVAEDALVVKATNTLVEHYDFA